MNSDLSANVKVEVGIYQREERVYERDVETRDQKFLHMLTVTAERAAVPR